MQHHVDGFSRSEAPHSFLVTPIVAHCAVIGPITPRSLDLIPELAHIQSVTSKSATLRWRSPGCPDACMPVSAFVVSVGKCSTSASVHAHASMMLDCQLAESEAVITVGKDACALDGWCLHTVYALPHHQPVRIRLQALGEGFREAGGNVTLVTIASGRARRSPSAPTLVWKKNVAGDARGASVHLTWSAPLLLPEDERVDRYKIGYWLVSDTSCSAMPPPPYPCFSYQESAVEELALEATVTGLRPDVSYVFKVFAGNLNGFEVMGSDPLTPVRCSHMPGAVERLSAVSHSDSSLMISWVNPSNPTPRKLLIKLTDLDCVQDETDKGAGAASVATSCVRSRQESCSIGKCAAAPSFCVGAPTSAACLRDACHTRHENLGTSCCPCAPWHETRAPATLTRAIRPCHQTRPPRSCCWKLARLVSRVLGPHASLAFACEAQGMYLMCAGPAPIAGEAHGVQKAMPMCAGEEDRRQAASRKRGR